VLGKDHEGGPIVVTLWAIMAPPLILTPCRQVVTRRAGFLVAGNNASITETVLSSPTLEDFIHLRQDLKTFPEFPVRFKASFCVQSMCMNMSVNYT